MARIAVLALLALLALAATLASGQSCASDKAPVVHLGDSSSPATVKGIKIQTSASESFGGNVRTVRIRSSRPLTECVSYTASPVSAPSPTGAPVSATSSPTAAATSAPTADVTPSPTPAPTSSAGSRLGFSTLATSVVMSAAMFQIGWVPCLMMLISAMVTPIAAQTCTPSMEFEFDLPNPMHAAGLEWVAHAYNNNGWSLPNAEKRYIPLASQLKPIGAHTGLLAEASDAGDRSELIKDGMSGDTDFPHGMLKTIITIGEFDKKTGYMPVGVPDGMGVYLKDETTIRIIFQAESYGHKRGVRPSWYLPVNGGAANFTGSHVSYVDYDRAKFAAFMTHSGPAVDMVKGSGELITNVYNVKGDPVGAVGSAFPHFGDTNAVGDFVTRLADGGDPNVWNWHSFCAAHLEEKHQWGTGIGLESSMFLTNEEWTDYDPAMVASKGVYGLSVHAIDLVTGNTYAVPALTAGGYEKVVEVNCGNNPDYVCISLSGYNGNFGGDQKAAQVQRRTDAGYTRDDGNAYAYPQDIVPARIYVGAKGFFADGTTADCTSINSDNYLACNGLAHGRVYGFAVPDATPDRDTWHKNNDRATSPDPVDGFFAQTKWIFDGTVRNFEHDQAWEFQDRPDISGGDAMKFWTALGKDKAGKKTEHNTPDPRGGLRFMQGSTAGYMGIYDYSGLTAALSGLTSPNLPESFSASYELIEGETDITARVDLNGKGIRADGNDQTVMTDSGTTHQSFEDIDGLEWFAAADGDYVLIQEDGGNAYGERTLLFKVPAKGVNPVYHFIAQAGGSKNSRFSNSGGVCIPAGTHSRGTSAEFSGAADVSGILLPGTGLGGKARRDADATVAIDDKIIAMGLQGHMCAGGVLEAFGLDRGGQLYAWQPKNIDSSVSASKV